MDFDIYFIVLYDSNLDDYAQYGDLCSAKGSGGEMVTACWHKRRCLTEA